tara:strand:+ start:5004 stop:5612 length:609 start_codon:yes stop_codon:yes gene_type:complete
MKQAAELPWTDGAGKALSKLAAVIHKQEMARADREGDTFSDPQLLVQDLLTGTTILLNTEPHTGGKTDGHGYRRCPDVRQRIPHKVPTGLQVGVLLDMLVKMIVPADAPPEQVGPLAQAAYGRIADAMIEAQEKAISTDKELAKHWKEQYAKHKEAVESVVQDIKDMTWSTRAGDTLVKVEAVPMEMAILDASVLKEREVIA